MTVRVKVIGLSEVREIRSKFGPRGLVEAKVGDDTGTVILSLWDDQIGRVQKDDTILIYKGYVTLVHGYIRLNVGKHGSITKSDQTIETVNTALDISAVEYERDGI